MPVEVDVDLSVLEGLLSGENLKVATNALLADVSSDTRDYVPVHTGALQDNVKTNNAIGGKGYASGSIEWKQQYANIVYNMDKGRIKNLGDGTRERSPHGTSHWLEEAKKDHAESWERRVAEKLFGDYLQ
jgi:hypothetical protein